MEGLCLLLAEQEPFDQFYHLDCVLVHPTRRHMPEGQPSDGGVVLAGGEYKVTIYRAQERNLCAVTFSLALEGPECEDVDEVLDTVNQLVLPLEFDKVNESGLVGCAFGVLSQVLGELFGDQLI